MNDPIVDEVRRVRDAHAAEFHYDLDAIFQDIKEQEKKSGLHYVSYPPRRTDPMQVISQTVPAIPTSYGSMPLETPPSVEL